MNVRQLIEKLSQFPDHMNVFLDERLTDEYRFGLLNSVHMTEVEFMEEPEGKVISKDNAVILSEE